MITPLSLHDSACDFLEKEIAPRFNLKSVDIHGSEIKKNPQVVRSGWVLPRSLDDGDYGEQEAYPYIAPRITSLDNVKNAWESVLDLTIMFGLYDPGLYADGKYVDDGSGYRDFWNLVEAVRQSFFTKHILDNRFRVKTDYFESELFDVQVYPYWEGYCITKWDVAYPLPQPDETRY